MEMQMFVERSPKPQENTKKLALNRFCANSIFQEFLVFQEPREFFPLFDFKSRICYWESVDWIRSASVDLHGNVCRASEDTTVQKTTRESTEDIYTGNWRTHCYTNVTVSGKFGSESFPALSHFLFL